MASTVMIGGLEKSGKTAFICALLQLAEKKGLKGAGFKPFDKGLLKRNARDELHDGERICRYMVGEPSETLVAPYYANEDYPIEMSFRRDGIRINWTVIEQRIAVLEELYDKTFVETPSSLLTPLTESMMVCDWMKTLKAELIWLIDPVQDHFLTNLSEINLVKEHGIPFTVVFNNRSRIRDQDLLFYMWEKIESFSGQEAAGMIPYIPETGDVSNKLMVKVEQSVPRLLDDIFNR